MESQGRPKAKQMEEEGGTLCSPWMGERGVPDRGACVKVLRRNGG